MRLKVVLRIERGEYCNAMKHSQLYASQIIAPHVFMCAMRLYVLCVRLYARVYVYVRLNE